MLALMNPVPENDIRAPVWTFWVCCPGSPAYAARLYDFCKGPTEHVKLSTPYVVTPAELVKCSLAVTLVIPPA